MDTSLTNLRYLFRLVLLCLMLQPIMVSAQIGNPFDVVPLGNVTHTAIQSGHWSDASTWDNGMPTAGAHVLIPTGISINIDGEIPTRLSTIRLEGKLVFSDAVTTELKVETIVGSATSTLEIGTATQPIPSHLQARILFIDMGPLDLVNDEGQFGKGLITMGKVEMHGYDKLAWTALATPPTAGRQTLTLITQPTGWQIGDEIVVAATQLGDPASDEKRIITGINGNTISLDRPLSLDHVPPQGYNLSVHVANLTRNIVLESENDAIDRRAHLMFMHSLAVSLSHVRMHKLGRTDKRRQVDDWFFPTLIADEFVMGPRTNIRGRYSCHFHRGGVDPANTIPALVTGCVVEDDPGWAYVNHSSNVNFINNVSYNVVGGAFQTESGNEIGSFIDNIALRTINPDYPLLDPVTAPVDSRESSQDFAFQGDGFWFHGGGVDVSGNVSSGSSGHGFIFWTEGQRELGTAFDLQNMFKVAHIPNGHLLPDLDNLQSWWVPVKSFDNNTTYSAINGFAAYYVHATLFEDITDLTDEYLATVHTTFRDLTIWNTSNYGIELQNCERFTFSQLKIINDSLLADTEGIRCWQTVANESNWQTLTVKGFAIGMTPPMQGTIQICGGEFTNEVDFRLIPPQRDSRSPGELRDMRIEDIIFGQQRTQHHILQETPIQMLGYETLTGQLPFLDPEYAAKYFLIPDRIRVKLEGLGEQTLYYHEQAANYVPITTPHIGLATGDYATLVENQTNQQIYNQAGLAFAGGISPANSVPHASIVGGVMSTMDIQRAIPACQFIQEGYYPANYFDGFDFYHCWDTSSTMATPKSMTNADFVSCNTASGNTNTAQALQLKLYPNPTHEILNIVHNTPILQIEVYGLTGQILQSKITNTTHASMNIGHLPDGIYLIKATTLQGKQISTPIVKQ